MADSPRRQRLKRTSRLVRLADVAARWTITAGGIGTIGAVGLVFVYLASVALPLLKSPELSPQGAPSHVETPPAAIIPDDYGSLVSLASRDGVISTVRLDTGELLATARVDLGAAVTSVARHAGEEYLAFGLADGSIVTGRVEFSSRILGDAEVPADLQSLPQGGRVALPGSKWGGTLERTLSNQVRAQEVQVEFDEPIPSQGGGPVQRLDFARQGDNVTVVSLTRDGTLRLIQSKKKKNLLTRTEKVETSATVIPEDLASDMPDHVLMPGSGDNAYLIWNEGRLERLDLRTPAAVRVVEEVRLVEGKDAQVGAVGFLVGRETLMCGDSSGRITAWFRTRPVDATTSDGVILAPAHRITFRPAGVTAIGPSPDSRLAAVGFSDGWVELVQVTAGRGIGGSQVSNGGPVAAVSLGKRSEGLLALASGNLWSFRLDPGYPEARWKTLFGRVWYESYDAPRYEWQTSGSSSASEPKMSLVPLVFGTLKATTFSMLFAVPLALLAAISTSEFLHRNVRSKFKPAIELLASLPSVVLGFVAAQVIAPFVADQITGLLCALVTAPMALLIGAHLWQLVPRETALRFHRVRIAALVICLPAGVVLGLALGPTVERWLFNGDIRVWLDRQNGTAAGGWLFLLLPASAIATMFVMREVTSRFARERREWTRLQAGLASLARLAISMALTLGIAWLAAWGLTRAGFDPRGTLVGTYDQRNALVVGFVMGFAVIPIIYTIADDALAAVPEHLRSASLGAGATPWQTAVRIVVPTAMSGLFSAVMVGLGRAVGETMIVIMAGGNTPIMDLNPFNGFHTLSAALAVELPESVQGTSHFRTLFLAALCLFFLTFVVNSVAEVVRMRFRKRAYEL
jgi:phosphate transport system permease protein